MICRQNLSILASAALLLSAPGGDATATIGERIARIQPDDGDSDDRFGIGISIRGDLALIGATGDEDGAGAGSAYLFDIADPFNPVQLAKLLPDDGAAGDAFGWRTAIGDGVVFVTAGFNGDTGAVYVFDISKDPENPVRIAKIVPEDAGQGDEFGMAVKVSGSTLFAGSRRNDENGRDAGATYVFDVTDPAAPEQLAKIMAEDGGQDDLFGAPRVSGNLMLVGAPFDGRGSAYVYDVSDPAAPRECAKIVAGDPVAGNRWAELNDISGNIAAVGALFAFVNGNSSGAVYLYDLSDPTNPVRLARVLPDDGAPGDFFGRPAIRGDLLVVGAHNDNGSGSAYFFDITDPSDPVQIGKVYGDDLGAWFGNEEQISGDLVLVKAQQADAGAGAVYLYDAGNTTCPADLDGSGSVDFGDILSILTGWGPCGDDCPQDLDGSGAVDFGDILAVLTGWGPCLCVNCTLTDDCTVAPVGVEGSYSFSNLVASDDGPALPESCDEGRGLILFRDVWFRYLATADGTATASTCDSGFDTRMVVYDTSDGACPGELIACNDDACGDGGTRAEVSFPVEAGRSYLVRIGGNLAVGEGTLVIDHAP